MKSSSSLSPEPYFLKPRTLPWRGFRRDALGRPAAGRVRVRCRGGAQRGARRRGARRCGRPSPRALSLRSQPSVKCRSKSCHGIFRFDMALNELSELDISKGFSDVDELLSSDK